MKSLLIALSSVLLTSALVQARSPVETHGRLRVVGTRLVDAAGAPVTLRGMSLFRHNGGNGTSEFWIPSVVKTLQTDWHASVVRAPVSARAYLSDGAVFSGFVEDSAGTVAKAFAVVDAAIASGMYVVVQFRATDPSGDAPFAKSFFHAMTNRYRDAPNLLWEIFHESPQASWNEISAYANQVIPVIRKHSQGVVIVATEGFSDRPQYTDKLLEKSFPNLAYAFHFIADRIDARSAVSQANAKGIPLFATEWAVTTDDRADSIKTQDIDAWLATLDSFGVSHCNLGLGNARFDATTVAALSTFKLHTNPAGPWSDQDLTPSGTFMRNLLRRQNPSWSLSDTVFVESLRIASPKTIDLLLGVDTIHLTARYNLPVSWNVTFKARHGTASTFRAGTGQDVSVQMKVSGPLLSSAKFREGDTIDVELMPKGASLWFTIQGPATNRSRDIVRAATAARGRTLRIHGLAIPTGERVDLTLWSLDGRASWSEKAVSDGKGAFLLESEMPERSSPRLLQLVSKSKHWTGILAPDH
jgi:endoglucanase